MKGVFTFIFIAILSLSTSAQEFKFDTETIDYGKVNLGSNGERTFVFTNTGNKPLIISKINSTCGCTIPKKPEKPILPGKKGEIKVSYDTKRPGGFSKSITIYSNAKKSRKVIRIKGFVNNAISLEKEKSMLSTIN